MVLNFWHERNKRIEKARAEARAEILAEARAEGRAKGRAEILAEGRAEAVRKVHAAWTAWNHRREEAAERGERFDEPPPSLNAR